MHHCQNPLEMTNFPELGKLFNVIILCFSHKNAPHNKILQVSCISNAHSAKTVENMTHNDITFFTRMGSGIIPWSYDKVMEHSVEKHCGHRFKMKTWSCVIFLQGQVVFLPGWEMKLPLICHMSNIRHSTFLNCVNTGQGCGKGKKESKKQCYS
jgi:hypothetical protein